MHLPIELDRERSEPLQNQLYEQLRELIISRRLKSNSRLIATRFLAEQLGISRTTVLLAYERLISEGYLETRPAVGTFVCETLPDLAPQPKINGHRPNGFRINDLPQTELHPPIFLPPAPAEAAAAELPALVDFWGGPDFRIFPLKTWQRITQHVLEDHGHGISRPPPPGGIEVLKAAIADWMTAHRGIVVDSEQIIVVAGTQQAYNIAARLFLRRGDRVVVECPGHAGAISLFTSLGAQCHPVPVDEQGLLIRQLPIGSVSLAYVTPSHQNPIGGTLPLDRREELIEWARRAGAYLIEDDCDGDFRYRGMGPPSIKSLDPYGLVLYAGTFSKILGAGLRLGYMVVPPELIGPATAVKTLLDNGSPWLEQMVLAEFIVSGEYDRHLRRIRKTYLERRDCLIGQLRQNFGDVRLAGIETGTHLSWFLPDDFPDARTIQTMARQKGVGVYALGPGELAPAEDVAAVIDPSRVLMLGYSSLEERQIRDGIAGLAAAIRARPPS